MHQIEKKSDAKFEAPTRQLCDECVPQLYYRNINVHQSLHFFFNQK